MIAYFRIEHVFLQIDNTILRTDTLLADHDLFFSARKNVNKAAKPWFC